MTPRVMNRRLTAPSVRLIMVAVLLAFVLVGCAGPFGLLDLAETVSEYFAEGDFERRFAGDVDLGLKVLGSGTMP